MNPSEELLVRLGSVRAVAQQVGEDAASEALFRLSASAPEEIQGSWPMVIAWHRAQQAYDVASRIGDSKGMLDASKAAAQIVKDLY